MIGIIPLVTDRMVPPPFRKNPTAFWFLFLLLAMGILLAAGWQLDDRRPYLGLACIHALGLLTVPLAFRYSYGQLVDWTRNAVGFVIADEGDDPRAWLERELEFFGGSLATHLFGLAISILATSVFYLSGTYLETVPPLQKYVALSVIFVSAYLAGLGLYVIFRGLRMLRRFGHRFRVRVSDHRFGIRSTGSTIVRILIAVSLVWSGYVAAAVFGLPEFSQTFRQLKWPVVFLVVPTYAFLIAAFVLCQFPLHRRMVEFKRDELFRAERALQEFDHVSYDALTFENKLMIDFYERRKEQILNLPEWPFDFRSLLQLGTSSLAVLWPALTSPFLSAGLRVLRDIIQV